MATTTSEQSIREAFGRARRRVALVHRIWPEARGLELYAVGSSADPDLAYVVRVHNGRPGAGPAVYSCTCAAGEAGRLACVHRAAVAIRRANDHAHAALRERGSAPLSVHARAAGLIETPPVPAAGAPRRLPPTEDVAWLDAPRAGATVDARSRPARRLAEIAEEMGR